MKPKEEIAWQEYRYKYLAKDDPNTVMYRLLFLAGYRAANQPFENMHVDSCTCEVCLNSRSASGIDSHLPGCTCGGIEGHHLLSCALRRPTPRAADLCPRSEFGGNHDWHKSRNNEICINCGISR